MRTRTSREEHIFADALARPQHDVGVTETGRPFSVMELVRGTAITKYCDENQVIHRDMKPSNIRVTVNEGAPTPKIIDFGIARATQDKVTDATIFTHFEQFIGTPVLRSTCPARRACDARTLVEDR